MVGRDAVAEAVQAAGVRADVAADHRGRARGRVGRVAQAVPPRLVVERGVGMPGLHERRALLDVELEDGLHAVEGDHEAAARGHGCPGQRTCRRRARTIGTPCSRAMRTAVGDVLGRLGIDQRLGPSDHVRGVARDGCELGRLGVHALAEGRAQRRHPGLRHAATMRGTAGSKRSTSRSMRPSSANVQVLVPRLRPAVQPPPSQSAVSTPSLAEAQAPEARDRPARGDARAACRAAADAARLRARARRAGRSTRAAAARAGRAEGALEGAHERLGIREVDGGAVGEGELAAGLGVRGIDRRAQRAGRRPAAAGQRALEARARRLQVGARRQREAECVAGLLAPRVVAGGACDAREHERDPAAVGVPVRPHGG